jgi:hypothetical protein
MCIFNHSLTLFCQPWGMKRAVTLALALSCAFPAWAAEEKGGTPKAGAPGTNVPMDTVLAPLTGVGGRLIAYAYVSSRLTAVSEAAVRTIREKQPFIQDAFVRDVNGRSVVTGIDPLAVNVAALEARMLADAGRIMGPDRVKSITVCMINIAELHPAQTPSPEPADAQHAVDTHQNPLKSRCESEKPA